MPTDTFKALSDPTRRQILEMLAAGDLSAGEIASHFSISAPSVSHHLHILKEAGLVEDTRIRQSIVYHLRREKLEDLTRWLYVHFGPSAP